MFGSTSIRSTVVTGQTEGLKVGCGGMGGRRDGRREKGSRYGRMGGFCRVNDSIEPEALRAEGEGFKVWADGWILSSRGG